MMHDMGDFGADMGWGMGFGWIFMLLFLTLIIMGIFVMVKWLSGGPNNIARPPQKTALDILKERYARGEIEQEEYQLKKHDLEQ